MAKTRFREDDIVRIETPPENNLGTGLVGLVCYIEEILKGRATIIAFDLSGKLTGSGTVPVGCLELVKDKKWHEAKLKVDAFFAKIEEEAEGRTRRWKSRLGKISRRFGITPKQVQEIYDLLNDPNETGR